MTARDETLTYSIEEDHPGEWYAHEVDDVEHADCLGPYDTREEARDVVKALGYALVGGR